MRRRATCLPPGSAVGPHHDDPEQRDVGERTFGPVGPGGPVPQSGPAGVPTAGPEGPAANAP
jgi:hypothetical protein